jgi:MraZ protein
MFRGSYPTRVDEKGRLKVPAQYKREIDDKYGSQFYITSWDGKIAQVYPLEEWERLEQGLRGLSTFNSTRKKLLTRTNYFGAQVEIDAQGRLLIPALLRDSANLKGDISVMGALDHLELRNMDEVRSEIEQPFTAEDEAALDQLLGH